MMNDPAFQLGQQADATEDRLEKLSLYQQAWDAVAEPKQEWPLILWLCCSIAGLLEESQDYEGALKKLEFGQTCMDGDTDSALHFDLGRLLLDHFEAPEKARHHFTISWNSSEGRSFEDTDPRYLKFLQAKG